MDNTNQEEAIASFVRWGESQAPVRAMILTSTRAIPEGAADIFSDYDIILALSDVQPFFAERGWLEAFGHVLVMYRDPLTEEDGLLTSGNVVQFEEGLKIDFTLWPVEMLQRIAAQPKLPDEFDAGYRVLLDKDDLTAALRPPAYQAYIPKPPTETEYREGIEDFFLVAIYVAKYFWRDDRVAAKHLMEDFMRQEHLLPMLVWQVELEHDWKVKPGLYGRGLKKWLRPDLWAELESTYTGMEAADNWAALYDTIALMRKTAIEVGGRLGYPYPEELDRRTMAYVKKIEIYGSSQ
jgi:aminoglycoside 6-adenylyltransferase